MMSIHTNRNVKKRANNTCNTTAEDDDSIIYNTYTLLPALKQLITSIDSPHVNNELRAALHAYTQTVEKAKEYTERVLTDDETYRKGGNRSMNEQYNELERLLKLLFAENGGEKQSTAAETAVLAADSLF